MTDLNKNYFTEEELSCTCCGENKFNKETLNNANALREFLDFPLPVTSGYRCPEYNTKMGYTQTHATGQALDISCTHEQAFKIMVHAATFGFTGIGIKQKGTNRFIHIDDLSKLPNRPRPHVWSY